MSIKREIELEIEAYLIGSEGQSFKDNTKALLELFNKHLDIFSTPVLLDKSDFDMIKSHAHTFMVNSQFPKCVGIKREKIDHNEANILAIIEGTIIVLNNKHFLRKLPKFYYRE